MHVNVDSGCRHRHFHPIKFMCILYFFIGRNFSSLLLLHSIGNITNLLMSRLLDCRLKFIYCTCVLSFCYFFFLFALLLCFLWINILALTFRYSCMRACTSTTHFKIFLAQIYEFFCVYLLFFLFRCCANAQN